MKPAPRLGQLGVEVLGDLNLYLFFGEVGCELGGRDACLGFAGWPVGFG
jgi:hypothetical protein